MDCLGRLCCCIEEDDKVILNDIDAYKYIPLREEMQEIRLITLLPSTESSDVHITLGTTPLAADIVPCYEALSYTWGSTERPPNIIVENPRATLSVTQNLAEALRYLRYEDRARVLWIDAICINQQDLDERSSQVAQMAAIYWRASRVVIWLGPQSSDSDTALDCIDLLSKKIWANEGRLGLYRTSAETEDHWTRQDTPLPFDDLQLISIYTLFHRPWFQRLWIWQEVRLTRQETIAIVGTRMITWNAIRNVVLSFRYKPATKFDTKPDLVLRMFEAYRLCSERTLNRLPGLIEVTKLSLCSDPRDKIYALLSLLTPGERDLGIQPNYAKSVTEVYQHALMCWSLHCKSLTLLQTAETSEDPPKRPSWVPDWSTARITQPLVSCNASVNLGDYIPFSFGDETMEALGVSIDTIELAEKFQLSISPSTWYSDTVREIQRMSTKFHSHCARDIASLSALCQVICSNYLSDLRNNSNNSNTITLLEAMEILLKYTDVGPLPTIDESPPSTADEKFFRIVNGFCRNRSLFRTRDGHIGLGPKTTAASDLVVVFLNSDAPIILQPRLANQFSVVGEAYCHGFMDREAFLGPLPSPFQFKEHYDQERAIDWYAYLDRDSGSLCAEDPRSGPLPPSWVRINHTSEKFYTWYVNEETGEELTHGLDPKFTVDAFRARGVKVQPFTLI